MTDMAFSSTVNATELKNSSSARPTNPTTSRFSRNTPICATSAAAWFGATSDRYSCSARSSAGASTNCDSSTRIRANIGTMDSSVL